MLPSDMFKLSTSSPVAVFAAAPATRSCLHKVKFRLPFVITEWIRDYLNQSCVPRLVSGCRYRSMESIHLGSEFLLEKSCLTAIQVL